MEVSFLPLELSATGRIETNSTLIGFSVQNAGGSGSATLTSSIFRNVPGYTAPINPPQPDGTSNLDDGDARLSAKIYRVGGVLFAVHNTELNGRAAVRWYRLSAINYTLLEAGTISDSQLDLFYPSIAANTNGNIVIGCNGSSLSTFVSCYALIGRTSQGVTTFGNPALRKSGVASYHNMGSTSTSRWGDYSTTSVDPDNPSIFWTIQMYPSSHSAWSTQITQLITNPQPVPLTMARAGANWLLCWSNTVATPSAAA